jgi:RimJ/RimL family protein N-acetyltransferase
VLGGHVDLRWISVADVDRIAAAQALFDYPVRAEWARGFVQDGGHHLCLAYAGDEPAGFVSGVEITHPDKGTEMMLYELAVDEAHRRRGYGRALIDALAGRARDRGCYGMFVLVDTDNAVALATYASTHPAESASAVMLTWALDPTHASFDRNPDDEDGHQGGGPSMAWPVAEEIHGPRLTLEPQRSDHVPELLRVLGDSRLYEFTGGAPPTPGELSERLARQDAGHSPDGSQGWLNWVVRLRRTGRAVGTVQATVARAAGSTTADLAWVTGVADQGQGYASEAATVLAGWLAGHGVDVLRARIHPDHPASAGVARRLGLAGTGRVADGEQVWAAVLR